MNRVSGGCCCTNRAIGAHKTSRDNENEKSMQTQSRPKMPELGSSMQSGRSEANQGLRGSPRVDDKLGARNACAYKQSGLDACGMGDTLHVQHATRIKSAGKFQ
ncbi:uncharacterized protein UMAG_04876 [Mycosarcoma maydis]|uniref:Uncharacterized protein n=1 Tax=Mycosarcoma maydis TaxID=5270 RepID=A0A0D1DW96_MYCMD|nr:uncharacterized protein UMAG_04876 [Ustilago maydis 521]KIS66815.1 hypothetical protein UMAG_04876 [Ustilago maydis 521]|eukprot:XP_011391714.1 hypothetical protein UMAG_04876 [Ustilago maydis 521]